MAKVGRLVKETIIATLNSRLGENPNLFVVGINRLPSSEASILRQQLFDSKSSMLVVQRTLARRVVEELKIAGLPDLLEGSCGIIIPTDDALAVAKTLIEFVKTHEEQFAVHGGLLDGQLLTKQRVKELAELPSKPVLLATVLATIEAPIANLILTVEQAISDVIGLIDQLAKERPNIAETTKKVTEPQPQEKSKEEKSASEENPAGKIMDSEQNTGKSSAASDEEHSPPNNNKKEESSS